MCSLPSAGGVAACEWGESGIYRTPLPGTTADLRSAFFE